MLKSVQNDCVRSSRPLAAFGVPVLLLIAAHAAAAQNLVTNPSFEAVQIGSPFVSSDLADVPGWTLTGSLGDGPLWAVGNVGNGGSITTAADGDQFVTLGGGFNSLGTTTWSQTLVGLTPGVQYHLSWDQATEDTNDFQSITVAVSNSNLPGGTSSTTFGSAADYWRTWQAFSANFTPTTNTVTLSFTATTPGAVGLDDVSVTAPSVMPAAAPEPGSFALLVAAAMPLAAFGARRRRLRVDG